MTAEEAIETLKLAQAEVEWEYPLDISVAINMAIEALDKQIPKPFKIDREMRIARCPRCILGLKEINVDQDGHGYCGRCGQLICWSEVEE